MASIKVCGLNVSKTVPSGTTVHFYLDGSTSKSAAMGSCAAFTTSGGRHDLYAQTSPSSIAVKSITCQPSGACATTKIFPGVVQVTARVGSVVVVDFDF